MGAVRHTLLLARAGRQLSPLQRCMVQGKGWGYATLQQSMERTLQHTLICMPLHWSPCAQVVGTGPDTPPPMQSHGMAVQGSLVSRLGSLELFHEGNSRTAQTTEQHEV